MARSFVALAGRQQIGFQADVPDASVPARFDPEQLEKVLVNLLSNAFKFTPPGGSVSVSVREEAVTGRTRELVIEVRDTGPGIAPEHLPHVFERFYQVDASSTRRQPGTGIGLALARELVELHHGHIDVVSEVGRGSTFRIRLPLEPRREVEAKRDAEEDRTANPSRSILPAERARPRSLDAESREQTSEIPGAMEDLLTVLVVDDNADVRAYMRRHLEPPYRVVEAANGRAALEVARRVVPDLIVSDVMMPEMDGYALCRAVKEEAELDFIPVILLTAKASEDSKITGLEKGADDYLTKPFSMRELTARIGNLITSRQRLKARFAETAAGPWPPLSQVEPFSAEEDTLLIQLRACIDAHLGDETFGIDDLAAALGLSRTTLYRRLRAVTDDSPMELLWQRRLEHAAHLLEQRAGTVSEIAYGVGFKSVSHFSTRFRDHFGVSPTDYAARFPGG